MAIDKSRKIEVDWSMAVTIVVVALFMAFVFVGLMAFLYVEITQTTVDSDTSGYLGTLGDFVGGLLNPAVALISVGMLAYTLIQNQRALRISADELAETRKELTRQSNVSEAAHALEKSKRSIEILRAKIASYANLIKSYSDTLVLYKVDADTSFKVYLTLSEMTLSDNSSHFIADNNEEEYRALSGYLWAIDQIAINIEESMSRDSVLPFIEEYMQVRAELILTHKKLKMLKINFTCEGVCVSRGLSSMHEYLNITPQTTVPCYEILIEICNSFSNVICSTDMLSDEINNAIAN